MKKLQNKTKIIINCYLPLRNGSYSTHKTKTGPKRQTRKENNNSFDIRNKIRKKLSC